MDRKIVVIKVVKEGKKRVPVAVNRLQGSRIFLKLPVLLDVLDGHSRSIDSFDPESNLGRGASLLSFDDSRSIEVAILASKEFDTTHIGLLGCCAARVQGTWTR